MAKKRQRFHSPPPTAPISTARDTSLAFRLNLGFFFRQLCIFVVLDLLLAGMALCGLILYGENRCADVAALVEERGVPTQDALAWMEASDYTITLLDGEPTGYPVPVFAWLPIREETADGLRLWDLSRYYQIQMPSETTPYAITVNLTGIFQTLYWAGVVVLVFQGIFLLTSLFGNNRSIRKVLRPLQELAATASRLSSMTHMSRQELEALAGELEEVLGFVRRYIRFDVLDEPVGAIELCGYTPEQLREYSHYPEKHFGQPHFLACYTDGPALLAVNKLRTVVRQTELAAYAAFRDADGNVTRGDMILGLNRLSSLMWIFMIKLKAGRYERK